MKLTIKNEELDIVLETENAEECLDVLTKGLIPLLAPSCKCDVDQRVVEEAVTTAVSSPTYKDSYKPSNKKLVFFYCRNCDITFAKMIDLDQKEEVICHNCNSYVSYDVDKLVTGTYKCGCGCGGKFLMHTDVTAVRCKDCGKKIFMVLNDTTGEYEGVMS